MSVLQSQWSVMKIKKNTQKKTQALSWESGDRKIYQRCPPNFSLMNFLPFLFYSHLSTLGFIGLLPSSINVY